MRISDWSSDVCSSDLWLTHKGTVGRAISGTVHIVGEDNETELAVGEEGAVFFESENVFEYHDDPEKTASSRHSKGWSTLGDVGKVDEEGFLYLTDRNSIMLIAGDRKSTRLNSSH